MKRGMSPRVSPNSLGAQNSAFLRNWVKMKHAAISKTQNLIITLRDGEPKLSWSKVATQVGLSRGNAQKLYARAKRELAARQKLQQQINAYADEGRRSVYAKRRRQLQRELEMARLCDEGAEPPPTPQRRPNPTSFGSPERQERLEEFRRQREEESMPPRWPPVPLIKPEPMMPPPPAELPQKAPDAKNGHSVDVSAAVPPVSQPAPPAPHPLAPPPAPAEPNVLQALRGEIGPADWVYANRRNKLMVPMKQEEPIRHAPYCPAAGGLGGCCCDASRGKSRNYNERF